jgi:hypothetical protein
VAPGVEQIENPSSKALPSSCSLALWRHFVLTDTEQYFVPTKWRLPKSNITHNYRTFPSLHTPLLTKLISSWKNFPCSWTKMSAYNLVIVQTYFSVFCRKKITLLHRQAFTFSLTYRQWRSWASFKFKARGGSCIQGFHYLITDKWQKIVSKSVEFSFMYSLKQLRVGILPGRVPLVCIIWRVIWIVAVSLLPGQYVVDLWWRCIYKSFVSTCTNYRMFNKRGRQKQRKVQLVAVAVEVFMNKLYPLYAMVAQGGRGGIAPTHT